MEFHTVIRETRKKRGYNQEFVAVNAGISATAYRNIESGNACPKLDTVLAICKVLEIDLLCGDIKLT